MGTAARLRCYCCGSSGAWAHPRSKASEQGFAGGISLVPRCGYSACRLCLRHRRFAFGLHEAMASKTRLASSSANQCEETAPPSSPGKTSSPAPGSSRSRARAIRGRPSRSMGPAKTRHQKTAAETRRRNASSLAQFPTRRPSGIREMPRYRAVLRGLRTLAGGDRTGWLGRQDSKLCIRMIVIKPERFRRRFAARCSDDEMLRLVSNQ
jgi:hypothetical protein